MKVLIIVATAGEAARLAGVPAHVVVSGVGAVAAALTTQQELMREPFDLVVSAGIGGRIRAAASIPAIWPSPV